MYLRRNRLSNVSATLGERCWRSGRGFLVSKTGFVDYYELLQLSSNADIDTIERVFRHLAKKFHPDNAESADSDRFQLIVEAHRTLSNPETRAGYDVKYQEYWNRKWKLASEASDRTAFGADREIRESLLSILYVSIRSNKAGSGSGMTVCSRLAVPHPRAPKGRRRAPAQRICLSFPKNTDFNR
jgi:curved DNA-binding protein CbpA